MKYWQASAIYWGSAIIGFGLTVLFHALRWYR